MSEPSKEYTEAFEKVVRLLGDLLNELTFIVRASDLTRECKLEHVQEARRLLAQAYDLTSDDFVIDYGIELAKLEKEIDE